MPELPEIQALVEGLNRAASGRRVTDVRVYGPAAMRTADPAPGSLVGRRVTDVRRRGKLVLVEVEDVVAVIHLMQAGRLGLYPAAADRPGKATQLSLQVEGDEEIRLRELSTERRASVHLVARDSLDTHPAIAHLGPEPLGLDVDDWRAALAAPSARLHTALRSGRRVAGIGRCYASEIMWAARLAPFASADRLADDELARLAHASSTVLEQALSRARERIDTRLPDREKRVTAVHRHAGEPCLRCGTTLRRVSFTGYELVYCPTCQTGGRIYADRRTSRFLR